LDAPGSLRRVMVRGIKWIVIFQDDPDRADFLGEAVRRLAPLLGVVPQSIYRAAPRGAARAAEWALLVIR
jgi:hypothetical protein